MKKILFFLTIFIAATFSMQVNAQLLAFPGAEGFGRYALGARGAANPTVYRVTNLNDSGSGSFRDAVSQSGRIVVFDVSGVIKINSRISISSNIYIAGQTAPGDGVVIYGNGLSCSGSNNVIIRHMRFYMGRGGSDGVDALTIANGHTMIFDHISVLWGRDENYSCNWDNKGTEPGRLTIQNSIVGQGLVSHSAGGLLRALGGQSIIRCLYINSKTRNPNVREVAQFINNTVYNWSTDAFRFGGSGNVWLWTEGNYFISGSNGGGTPYASDGSAGKQVYYNTANPDYFDSNRNATLDGSVYSGNHAGSTMRTSLAAITGMPTHMSATVTWLQFLENNMEGGILSAPAAHQYVVNNAGATLPARSGIDDFLIDDLLKYGNSNSQKHIAEERANGIYNNVGLINNGQLFPRTAGYIPDYWKESRGLAIGTNWDLVKAPSGYYWLEEYINSIDGVTVKSGQPYLTTCYRFEMTARNTSSISLKWKNRMLDADGLLLQRSTNGTSFTDVATLPASATTYTVNGLDEDTFYTFRIVSSRGGNSVTSETARFSTTGTPGKPLACSAAIHPENNGTSKYYTAIEFIWENETGDWSQPVTYDVYFGTSAGALTKINTAPISTTQFDYRPATPLDMKKQYYWRVDASNKHGVGGATLTTEGPVWSFTTSSFSFTENFVDIGRDFSPPSTFIPAKSGISITNTTSINVTYPATNGDRVTFTRSGGSFVADTDNGVYRQATGTPTWRLTDAGNYVNIEPANYNQSREKFISKVTLNGTDADPGTTGRSMPVVLFSDRVPFDVNRILDYAHVTISKCRGNTEGTNHVEWEPQIMLNAPVGTKSVRIYNTVRLNELDREEGIQYAVAANGDINLPTSNQARLAYFGVMLEHITNDGDPMASSVNTITEATINGKTATISNSANTITYKFPLGTTLSEMPVTFKLGHDKATVNFTSGDKHNFAEGPLKIEVTAENGDKRKYTVSATLSTKFTIGMLTTNGQKAGYDDKFFSAFSDYDIKLLNAGSSAPANIDDFYDGCDLIVVHANVAGDNATLGATRNLVGKKPILSMKVFCYNSGRWSWSSSNAQNTAAGTISTNVATALQNHSIFRGVIFSGTSLTFYSSATNVANGIQLASNFSGTNFTTALTAANHIIATTSAGTHIHEVNLKNEAKYIMIGLSQEGSPSSYELFNTNTINILKNAAAYLLNPYTHYNYATNQVVTTATLTNYSANICHGETYSDNNFTDLTKTGYYRDTLPGVNGIDSIIGLTLTVFPLNDTIYINATIKPGETYTENGFNESEAGRYERTGKDINGCEQAFVLNLTVSSTGLKNEKITEIKLYPNPVNEELRIMNEELRENSTVEIFDISGRKIVNCQLSIVNSINVSHLSSGVYIIKIGEWRGRFVKE